MSYQGKLVECGQFPFADKVDNILMLYRPAMVVIEEFRLRLVAATVGSTVPTIEVIGVMKYLCGVRGLPFCFQQPSQKICFSDNRIKSLGLYQKGKPHATDAVRHSTYFLTFTAKTAYPQFRTA